MAEHATPRDPATVDLEKGEAADKASTAPTTDLEDATVIPEAPAEAAEGEKPAEPEDADPNMVDWDGPDDPQNPKNWPENKKWLQIVLLSVMTIITPLPRREPFDADALPQGSSMFAPGIQAIMAEFHSTSSTTATFLVSIYILGFAFGPLLIAPLSETFGRSPLYQWGNILFTVFSVGAALSTNMGMLLAFRFLMGLAGAVPITIGSGSIADIIPVEKRGRAMSVWALGPLLGPCIGPVAGGYLIAAAGWRWVYWLIVIAAGILILPSFFFMNETYGPVVLDRKVARLRKETGNAELYSKLDVGRPSAVDKFKLAIMRPLKLLAFTPLVTLLALYVAITYGILYLMLTTFSFVYAQKYGFGPGIVGLTFLPAGIGMMLGVVGFGIITDRMVKTAQGKGFAHKPEIRITPRLTIPAGIPLPIGLFLYGWSTQYSVHWIVPMIGVLIFAAGLMGIMMCVQNYLLDSYLRYAASVTAALAVLRSLLGALLPLGGLQMYNTLGLGWGNSLLGFVSLALIPIPVFFYKYGERLRQRFTLESI
ncbi:MFS general substrate transporter [Thozetella sp. PMI_491]|nr:MFS general substrate transporter [Thozetella sp. PMI_491]